VGLGKIHELFLKNFLSAEVLGKIETEDCSNLNADSSIYKLKIFASITTNVIHDLPIL
jgi:hypothetical protein